MNSTNRGANRLLLLVAGLILLALGALALALAAVPALLQGWSDQATTVTSAAPGWAGDPVVGTVSLLGLAVGLVAAVLIVLLIAFIGRQGRGHTSRVVEQHSGTSGPTPSGSTPVDSTLIDLGVPRALLDDELGGRPEFVATRVSAYRVQRTPALKVSVQCRRGVSPVEAAATVTRALTDLDAIVGTRIPALVQISGGFRSRTSSRARLT